MECVGAPGGAPLGARSLGSMGAGSRHSIRIEDRALYLGNILDTAVG